MSGANFAVAETGTLMVVESEGNGRMCLTLPRTLITVLGVEKLVPTWRDLEVFLQLLPRSSTAERMNPYTSMWTGAVEGQQFHLVLLDNGRTATLADPAGRAALRCIRCSACLNVCPVYERTGGHAYGSTYPGPIGAVLTPQLVGVRDAATLPFASTLCGACLDVCPVAIDIPAMLVHLRAQAVAATGSVSEGAAMTAAAWVMRSPARWALAVRLSRLGRIAVLRRLARRPLRAWTASRDLPMPPPSGLRSRRSAAVPEGIGAAMNAREEILRRVRTALADGGRRESSPVDRRYETAGSRRADAAQFIERVSDYGARVRAVPAGDLPAIVAETVEGVLIAPHDIPSQWLPGRAVDPFGPWRSVAGRS